MMQQATKRQLFSNKTFKDSNVKADITTMQSMRVKADITHMHYFDSFVLNASEFNRLGCVRRQNI